MALPEGVSKTGECLFPQFFEVMDIPAGRNRTVYRLDPTVPVFAERQSMYKRTRTHMEVDVLVQEGVESIVQLPIPVLGKRFLPLEADFEQRTRERWYEKIGCSMVRFSLFFMSLTLV